ncbi:hypothetical protein Tsubulata_038079 [Turnera subulata]|uniref:Pentacotripeptide-repeat region of PRORP domain-containing protein n=1 Tax=Turnera subulata TaxID=218843 RepID=A0A9Q0GFK3_9ROSI|nr:hypothetical protein Tsubulata_038079 [Turnera subulata]
MSIHGDFLKHRLLQLVQSCTRLRSLHTTKPLHALTITLGSNPDDQSTFVHNNIISLYASLEQPHLAYEVFDKMLQRNKVSYNTILGCFSRCGYLEEAWGTFVEMRNRGITPNNFTLSGLLSCATMSVTRGIQLQALAVKNGLFSADAFVGTSLLGLFGRSGWLDEAYRVFEDMPWKNLVTWNSMISLLGHHGFVEDCVFLFRELARRGEKLSEFTFEGVFSGLESEQDLEIGELIHGPVIKMGFDNYDFVVNSLLNMYVRCASMSHAEKMFEEARRRDVVTWNTIIGAYAKTENPGKALELFMKMHEDGLMPNQTTFVGVINSSSSALELKQLHSQTIRMGYENNEYVLSSLIAAYGRNGLIYDALAFASTFEAPLPTVPSNCIAWIYNRSGQYFETLKLLSELEEPDTVSWNIVIAACARDGHFREAAELFKQMHTDQVHPDNYTYVSILTVCSELCNLALGSSIHALLIKTNFGRCDAFVCNLLIDMYGKCGSVESSVKLFDSMAERNLITWTALISALGINGRSHEALLRFKEMESLGFGPDKVTFIAVLTACRHGALVKEGIELFAKMHSYGIEPELDHYHCLVDLLAKNGHLEEAEKVISSMPFPPNALIWRSFLKGCRRHRNAEDQAASR